MDKGWEQLRGFIENWVKTTFLSDMSKLVTTVSTSVIAVVKSLTNFIIGLVASIYMLWSKDTFRAQTKKIMVATMRPSAADRLLALGAQCVSHFQRLHHRKAHRLGHHRRTLCYIGCEILKNAVHGAGRDDRRRDERHPVLWADHRRSTECVPHSAGRSAEGVLFCHLCDRLQQLDGNVIGPKILGNTVGISGFWVLASITIAASIFGFAGMLLGVPVFALIYVLISDGVNARLRKKQHSTVTGGLPRHPDRGGSGDAAARAARWSRSRSARRPNRGAEDTAEDAVSEKP